MNNVPSFQQGFVIAFRPAVSLGCIRLRVQVRWGIGTGGGGGGTDSVRASFLGFAASVTRPGFGFRQNSKRETLNSMARKKHGALLATNGPEHVAFRVACVTCKSALGVLGMCLGNPHASNLPGLAGWLVLGSTEITECTGRLVRTKAEPGKIDPNAAPMSLTGNSP